MIDTHQHFWNYNPTEYGWITDDIAVLRQDFLPDDLEKATGDTGVNGVISVQARRSIAETDWLLDLASRHSIIKGVVAWVPLKDPAVGTVLDRLADNRSCKGVREILQGSPPQEYFESPEFHRGIDQLTSRGIAYELLIFDNQLSHAARFVDAHPNQRFILDHIAKPQIRSVPDSNWTTGIGELAKRQNVFCKFSGLTTEVRVPDWNVQLLRPWFEIVLEAFGENRVMFGSDWPVCLLRTQYARWISTVKDLADMLSPLARQNFFSGNAQAIYGLV